MFFRPYSREELKEILTERAWKAFKPDAVDHEVIDECVKYTAEEHRDVRGMVDLLRVCGGLAECEGSDRVEKKHFTKALEIFEMGYCKGLFDGLAGAQMNMLYPEENHVRLAVQ